MTGHPRTAFVGVVALLCLTGCTTLVDADPERTPTPTAEVHPTPEPSMPKSTILPLVPDPARSTQTSDAKLESLADRITKDGYPELDIVPGTLHMLLDERFTGPIEFDLPRAPRTGDSAIVIAVSCVPEGSRFTATLLDDEFNGYNEFSGVCGKDLRMGSGGERALASRIRVMVAPEVEVQLGVARGETAGSR